MSTKFNKRFTMYKSYEVSLYEYNDMETYVQTFYFRSYKVEKKKWVILHVLKFFYIFLHFSLQLFYNFLLQFFFYIFFTIFLTIFSKFFYIVFNFNIFKNCNY